MVANEEKLYLEEMVEKYADLVYRLAISRTRKKEDAEDVFQEVFYKFSKYIPAFENESHEKAWFIRVTINCSKNLLSNAWNRKIITLENEIEFTEKENGDVYFEVLRLPLKYRTAIQLFYYERLSVEEIGDILKLNPNTVKTHLARARMRLKSRLEGGFDNE